MTKPARTKTYSRRSSITTVMKRMGLKPDEYDQFIQKRGSKQFVFKFADAEEYLMQKKLKTTSKKKGAAKKKVVSSKIQKSPSIVNRTNKESSRKSMTQTCKDLILEGLSNDEIFKILKKEFNATEKHKSYPSWNRCLLRRTGQLPPAFDPLHQDKAATHKMEE